MDLNCIFLTGATGVLGAHLLKELLETTQTTVYCLVRADSPEHGLQRLSSLLKVYDPDQHLTEAFNRRVHAVLGDVATERFGLIQKDYDLLARQIDVTLHAAANTNLFTSFRRISPINLGGTENAIQFALATSKRYLCYVSTYTVMGDKVFDRDLIFKETDLDIGQGFDHMSYQESKFLAETKIRKASQDGLIWNIFRPGQIFGESNRGHYPQGQTNVSGLFYDIFKTVIETNYALYSETHYDVVPVDFVSRAIVHLGLRRPERSQTFHLTNPDIKSYTEVIQLLAQLGYDITIVPQAVYKRMLFNKELLKEGIEYNSFTVKAFRWWFQREGFDFSQGAVTHCASTQNILQSDGIFCPQIDLNLMNTYVDAGIRLGYFPKTHKKAPVHEPTLEPSFEMELDGGVRFATAGLFK